MEFLFGSDPEFMLHDPESNKYISAIKVLNHGKEDPIDLGEGSKVFYDNVLVELNVPPASSAKAFTSSLYSGLSDLKEIIGSLDIVLQATAVYQEDQIDDPPALMAGCDPEFSIWNTDEDGNIEKSKPVKFVGGRRTAGGHIHIGHDIGNIYAKPPGSPVRVIQMMDLFVGNTSVLIDHDPFSFSRKKLYGAAGSHRPCTYGVEYRTLSNFWLASPRLINIIYQLTNDALELVESGEDKKLWQALKDFPITSLRDAINNHSVKEAEKFYRVVSSYLDPRLQSEIEFYMNPAHRPDANIFTEYTEQLEVMVA